MLKLAVVLRFLRRSTLLITVGLVGGTVTTAGVVMLVTPGPGLVVIIAGLAILSTQFAWAERALDKVKQKAISARDKASARRAHRRGRPAPPASDHAAEIETTDSAGVGSGAAGSGAAGSEVVGSEAVRNEVVGLEVVRDEAVASGSVASRTTASEAVRNEVLGLGVIGEGVVGEGVVEDRSDDQGIPAEESENQAAS